MKSLTVFSWGYWGWGNSGQQAVVAMDAVEASRGLGPPVFADCRAKRSVRARAFNGNSFEVFTGAGRYVWIPGLGNEAVRTGRGAMRLVDPRSVATLLELVDSSARQKRRVIFFCACAYRSQCHRDLIASTMADEARLRGIHLDIVEWPGGEPEERAVPVDKKVLRAVRAGGLGIPLGLRQPDADLLRLPAGSILRLHASDSDLEATAFAHRVVMTAGAWKIELLGSEPRAVPKEEALAKARQLRREYGFGK